MYVDSKTWKDKNGEFWFSWSNGKKQQNVRRGHFLSEIQVAHVSSDSLCGLVARVLGYRSGGPGSILGTTKKKVVGLERGPLSLVSITTW
jgi:hypothetical protein